MRTLFILITLGVFVTNALAQQADAVQPKPANSEQLSSSDTFVPLTTWEKVKLGSAYYTNPEAVKNAPVAYTYKPTSFSPASTDALKELQMTRQVLCVKNNPVTKSFDVTSCSAQPSDQISFVSTKPKLLGKPADDVVKLVSDKVNW